MADYIFIRKSRNFLSSFLHIFFNLALAIVSIGATIVTGSYIIGLILVVVSKWRIFAVNHRYWLLNIRSSLVDFIVGTSFVLLAYAAGTTFLPVHFALMAGYSIWLILIKPRSSAGWTIVQAISAIILGTTAASIFAAISSNIVLVISGFIIGYSASHHVLVQNDNRDASYLSFVCGLVFAEISWLSNNWLILYTMSNTGICISQLSLILAVIAFAYFRINAEISTHGNKFKFKNVALPVLFCLLIVVILIIGFSQPRFNIH